MRVIVTGAAQGIGEAVARRLGASGHQLLLADIQAEKVARVAESLEASSYTVDISSDSSVSRLYEEIARDWDHFDALINVAGIDAPFETPEQTSPQRWGQLIDVNLNGTWRCISGALPTLKKREDSRVVNIASICGVVPTPGVSVAYIASKAGVVGLTMGLATELEPDGVRVNAIAPGATGSTGNPMSDAEKAVYREAQPLGLGGPEPIAGAVEYLLGPDGSWVSGVVMNVSGGYWRGR